MNPKARDTLPSPPPSLGNGRAAWRVLVALAALWLASLAALFWLFDPRVGAAHPDADRASPTAPAPDASPHHHARGGPSMSTPWPSHAKHHG